MLSLNKTHHFICGGWNEMNGHVNNTYIFSDNKFTQVSGMGVARAAHSCAVVDQNVFAVGGYNGNGSAHVEYFSLRSLTWHTLPDLPIYANQATLTVLDGDLYLLGGTNSKAIYSLKTSSGKALTDLTWEQVGNLRKEKKGFAALRWEKQVCS